MKKYVVIFNCGKRRIRLIYTNREAALARFQAECDIARIQKGYEPCSQEET